MSTDAMLLSEGYSNTEAADRLTATAEEIGLSENEGGACSTYPPRSGSSEFVTV